MRIKLTKLKLNNFQGGTFTLDTKGKDVSIYAANGLGKTRLVSAFSWLLFDKDSLGRSDFEIKNLDATGEAEHGIEHSVFAEFDLDGKYITMEKTYRERWDKKRGSPLATFTGHTTDYEVNGVPIKKKDYTEQVKAFLGDENMFRLLTSPTTFTAMHWMKQREMLIEVCGDISNEDIINSTSKLSGLLEILDGRSIKDQREIIAARRTKINKQIEKIPIRIDEVTIGLPDVTDLNAETLAAEIAELSTEIGEKKLLQQGIDTGGEVARLSKEINIAKAELQDIESAHYQKSQEERQRLSCQIVDMENALRSANIKSANINDDIDADIVNINMLNDKLVTLRADWDRVNFAIFSDTTEDICPACEQPLPSEKVASAKEQALNVFNLKKAKRLEEINTEGRAIDERKETITLRLEALKEEKKEVDRLLQASHITNLESMKVELERLKTRLSPYDSLSKREETLDVLERKASIKKLESDIELEKDGRQHDVSVIDNEIIDLNSILEVKKELLQRFETRDAGTVRINELKDQEKKLATEYEQLERELYLTELFIKTKVGLLTEKINGLFKMVSFKLFDVQVNGGISECCVMTVKGVPHGRGLNRSAELNGGLDICRTLSKYYQIYPPVFVDNAESVCKLIEMDTQVIRLVVSEKDKTLRVEER